MTTSDPIDFRSMAEKSLDFIGFLAKTARLQRDPRVQACQRVIAANPGDSKTIREVTQQAVKLITSSRRFKRAMRDHNPFKPSPGSLVSGPIVLGITYDPVLRQRSPAGLFPEEIQQNLLLCGRAGSGKTNFVYVIISSLLQLGIPFWAIDFKKDYRHLLRKIPNLHILNTQTLQFNTLRPPPGTSPIEWLQIWCNIFCEIFFPSTSSASKNLLLNLVDQLYREHGVYDGSDSFPTILELDARLDPSNLAVRITGQDIVRMHTLRNKTFPLVKLLGAMISTDPGFSMKDLLQSNVVFEYDSLTSEIQQFLINLQLHWIFSYRKNSGQRGKLRHLLIFDEAKMVYAQDRAKPSSQITQLTSMAREFGQGLIVSDQMPSSLGEAIKANCFATVTLNLSSMRDIQAMAYAMGLNERQRQFLISIPRGTGVVRYADRHTQPFLLKIPRFDIQKDVSDEEVNTHMGPILERLASGRKAKKSRPSKRQNDRQDSKPRQEQALPEAEASGVLSVVASSLLTHIRDWPFQSVVERYGRLGLNPRAATKALKDLVKADYLTEVEIAGGGRGRPGKYYQMTAKAEHLIGHQDLGPGKGGFVHRFYQHKIQQYYEILGHLAKIEVYRSGKSVDIGVWKPGKKIAVEVEMSPVHALDNIQKDFAAGWDGIVVAFAKDSVFRKIQAEVQSHPDCKALVERIEFISVRKLLP